MMGRWRAIIGALLACALLCAPSSVRAQALEAAPESASVSSPCPPPRVEPSSNLLLRTLLVEYSLLSKDVCKILNWSDRFANIENLVVHLFTGPGLHPTAGIVVPESGAAGGLALNLEWNQNAPLYERFTTNFEGRASEEGFWAVGGKLQALFSGSLDEGKASQFTFSAKHFDLPRLPY